MWNFRIENQIQSTEGLATKFQHAVSTAAKLREVCKNVIEILSKTDIDILSSSDIDFDCLSSSKLAKAVESTVSAINFFKKNSGKFSEIALFVKKYKSFSYTRPPKEKLKEHLEWVYDEGMKLKLNFSADDEDRSAKKTYRTLGYTNESIINLANEFLKISAEDLKLVKDTVAVVRDLGKLSSPSGAVSGYTAILENDVWLLLKRYKMTSYFLFYTSKELNKVTK